MSDREHIPMEIQRAVLVEAGYRCAIPTCRYPTTEIAHIVPYARTKDNSFENLIALCPNCHTRYDKGQMGDAKAMRIYKQNLGILHGRYSELERRVFERAAADNERFFVLHDSVELLLMNAVRDGLLQRRDLVGIHNLSAPNNCYRYEVTEQGVEFANRYFRGEEIS
jgi:hypothetical protein